MGQTKKLGKLDPRSRYHMDNEAMKERIYEYINQMEDGDPVEYLEGLNALTLSLKTEHTERYNTYIKDTIGLNSELLTQQKKVTDYYKIKHSDRETFEKEYYTEFGKYLDMLEKEPEEIYHIYAKEWKDRDGAYMFSAKLPHPLDKSGFKKVRDNLIQIETDSKFVGQMQILDAQLDDIDFEKQHTTYKKQKAKMSKYLKDHKGIISENLYGYYKMTISFM